MGSGFYHKLLADGKITKPEDIEPDNTEAYQFYIDAFTELSSCRSIGMALGPIPFTAIMEYSRIFEVEDAEEFLYFIRRMDNIYVIHMSDESKSKSAQAGKKISNGGQRGKKNN